ncbi:MAG: hypothetical protein NVSMB42_23120 [Herpetosiphon sp.]
MRRVARLLVALAIVVLFSMPAVSPTAAAPGTYTRIADGTVTHIVVDRADPARPVVWTADRSGFSTFEPTGTLTGRFRWPPFSGSVTYEFTEQLAVTGTPRAVWTVGYCCVPRTGPTVRVLVPGSASTETVSMEAAWDIGRTANGATTIATDGHGHPWLATTVGLWFMARGWQTPLNIDDDAWIEVTTANGERITGVSSIRQRPDGTIWLGRSNENGMREALVFRLENDQPVHIATSYFGAGTRNASRLLFDDSGQLYLLSSAAIVLQNDDGTTSTIVSKQEVGSDMRDAAFVGNSLWIAAEDGLYRRGALPTPPPFVTYGPAHAAASYRLQLAAGLTEGCDPVGGWHRTDEPVRKGIADRSMIWGPLVAGPTYESYAEAPFGVRRVIYFDKARMEVTNPTRATVTNGLLVVELVTGRLQNGASSVAERAPSRQLIAGDPTPANRETPTYEAMGKVVDLRPGRYPSRLSQLVTEALSHDGTVQPMQAPLENPAILGDYDSTTGHNIPAVFSTWIRQTGPVFANRNDRQTTIERVIDPISVVGHPIAEPYWIHASVRGVEQWVLVQLFERRVLTWTPHNPPAFQVEMGNVGQHYYAWRYHRRPWQTDNTAFDAHQQQFDSIYSCSALAR